MSEKPIVDRSPALRPRRATDWSNVDKLTDAEIEAAVESDPDAAPVGIDWSRAEVVVPKGKTAVSIRVDTDVLDFFKAEGAGYQSRINAVLREYVRHRRRA